MQDVVEARVMLERSSVSLAAAHADAAALAAIRDCLLAMDRPGVPRSEFNEADTGFHLAIAEAGGNRLVTDMTAAIRGSLRSPILDAFNRLGGGWEALADELRAQHHGIFAAVEAGDGEAAAERMEQHIRFAFEALPELKPPGR